MPSREIIWVEKHQVSSLCVAGVVSYQGRQPYMEDRFSVITNINNSEVSLYSIFDGHAGAFAADYACEVIMPSISEKITNIMNLIKLKTEIPKVVEEKDQPKVVETKIQPETKEEKSSDETDETLEELDEEVEEPEEPEPDPLWEYITPENLINYEKLLFDEVLAFDKILIERMTNAHLFCGTTANIVLVDLTNKLIICANVGDSRAVMCDSKGNAFALSADHKPNNPEEMSRIRENGGFIRNINGCWRVDGSLACSRSLGDYPLKLKKVIIADPDITTFKFKDFK
jgi:protein phosphatase 1L